jgi:hypothetical protein
MEIRTAEPLVPGTSHLEAEIAIAKLRKYKSPGSDEILAEQIQAGGEILLPIIHKPINCISNKEELPDLWNEFLLLYQFARMLIKLTVIIIEEYHCYQVHTKFYRVSFFKECRLLECYIVWLLQVPMILQNVGSYKRHKAHLLRRRHSS